MRGFGFDLQAGYTNIGLKWCDVHTPVCYSRWRYASSSGLKMPFKPKERERECFTNAMTFTGTCLSSQPWTVAAAAAAFKKRFSFWGNVLSGRRRSGQLPRAVWKGLKVKGLEPLVEENSLHSALHTNTPVCTWTHADKLQSNILGAYKWYMLTT